MHRWCRGRCSPMASPTDRLTTQPMRAFWRQLGHTSGARIYGLLMGFVSLALTARWLGPEGRGAMAAAISWVALFATFGHLSVGQVVIHRAARQGEGSWLARYLGTILGMTGLLSLAGWLVALTLYLSTEGSLFRQPRGTVLLLAFALLPFLLWEHLGSPLLLAADRLSFYNNAQMLGRTCAILALVLAFSLGGGIVSAITAVLVGHAVATGAGVRELRHRAGAKPTWDLSTAADLAGSGSRLHLNAVGSFLIMSTDVLIINYYRSQAETGYYQLALQLIELMLLVPAAATTVLYGRVATAGVDEAWRYQRRALVLLTLLVAASAVAAAFVAPLAIRIVAGDEFLPAAKPFRLLLPALVGMTFSTLIAPQWIGRGWFWQASALTLTIGVLNLLLSLWLVPQYGMYGAIWGTLLTYAVSVLVNGGVALWCERRYRRSTLYSDGAL
jgi:O-antigen/teichoic acid export membrane protein